MEQLIEAIKSNDLVKAKKAFGSIMLERTSTLIEAEKIAMAKSVMIEGEEPESEEKDEKEENEKDAKKPNKFEKEKLDDSEKDEGEDDEEEE